MLRSRRSTISLAGAVILGVLVVGLPVARGGVDWRIQAVAVLMGPLACWLVTRDEERVPRAALLLSMVLGVCALQLVPVPPWAHRLTPEIRRLFDASLTPLGLYPATRPWSLDPLAGWPAFARSTVAVSVFVGAWAAGLGKRRRSLLISSLAVAGLIVASMVLVGALAGRAFLSPRFPFVNPNHLAGFLALTSFVTLGLALRAHGQARLLWFLSFGASVSVLFASLSRGGIGAFLGGAVLFMLLGLRREQRAHEKPRNSRLGLLIGMSAAIGMAVFLVLDPLLIEASTLKNGSDEEKIGLWASATHMIKDHPLLGVGHGAFQSTFPAYKSDEAQVTFAHLENEWLQPLVELGIPAGLLLVGTLGCVWAAAARRRDLSWTEVGLLAGVASLAAHNVVDFSLELPGVAVPFMVALGLGARGSRSTHVNRGVLAAVVITLAAVSLMGLLQGRSLQADQDSVAILMAPDTDAAIAAAREAVKRRPADFLAPATAGARLVDEGRCGEALPWLNRAMLLNPTAPEPHLFAGRCLAAHGQDRLARREYRLAWTFGRSDALTEALDRYPALADLLEVAPQTPAGLLALGDLLFRARPADAATVYRKAVDDFHEGQAIIPLARATRATGSLAEALQFARMRTSETPTDPRGWRLAAEIILELDGDAAADAEVRRGLTAIPGAIALQGFLVERALATRRFGEARLLAEDILARTPEDVATKQLLIAKALAAQGRLIEAIDRARSAAAAQPYEPWPLLALAGYCEQAGRFDDAISTIERVAGLPGQDRAAYTSRIEALAAAKQAQQERRLREGLGR